MKVIMLENVKNIGKKGEVVEVKEGYGANYLIPRKLAVRYTQGAVDVLESQIQDEKDRVKHLTEEAILAKEKLESVILEYTCKASKDGRMCGSISFKQVEQDLLKLHNIKVDKRKIVDKVLINAFGYTNLKIELYKGVIGNIKVHVSEAK